ncbi:hypothetical protein [Paenibacillus popilliae]|uniref:Uncharacterized protein n=1 Tax=Paenibacillus popilliae TaxID=78057 RepID=A0ABY3AJI0_PAEPP|nr:hypothetical protein [Paenibacillus sp. SDF0028]TQR41112.1 hypothetical protein C7Y44_26035 [Paenibacillus sp. SDF0028]
MKNIAKDVKYLEHRKQILLSLQNKYKDDKVDIYYSPDKEYKLTIEYFISKENEGWNYTRGIVTQCSTGNEVVLIRNIGTFLFEWVLKDQESYLLCGQDYQGYTIVNLKDMKVIDFVPEEFYEGMGFCWAEIQYTNEIDVLVVGGCYWADEYEIVLYDFSNPLQLPYKELKRIKPYEKIIGWIDNSNFQYEDEEGNRQIVKIF